MNDASEQRITIAKRNAITYLVNPKVKAIGVAGSVARGQADAYSDIDMSLYYEELPSPEELKAAYEQNQGSDYRVYADERESGAIVEQYFVQGIRCDFGHVTIERFERDIGMLLEQCDPDNLLLKVLEGTVDMLALHGTELINKWKGKGANYPDELAQAMVKKHLNFRPLWILQNYGVERGDVLFFFEEILIATKNIIGVLSGLNRFYHPVNPAPFKGMDRLIEKMMIAPHNLSSRLKELFRVSPHSAVHQLGELIEETFTLVETYMPEVDTTEEKKRYTLWSDKF